MVIDEANILIYFGMFYVSLMCFLFGLYMRSMHVQYKNAHDKWYDINRDTERYYDKSD